MELINKAALIAEIKRIEEQNPHIQHGDMLVNRDRSIRCNLLEDLLDFINTLEVKKVDLGEERMKDCPYRVVGCERYLGTVTECNGACAWVVDYLTLKELKVQKGE